MNLYPDIVPNPQATQVTARLAGRARVLQLRIGEIGELERLTGAGIAAIFTRLATMQWQSADIVQTIRLGLEGGGASNAEAEAIVERYVEPAPLGTYVQLAADVVRACVAGEVDAAEKPTGEGTIVAPATSPPSGEPVAR